MWIYIYKPNGVQKVQYVCNDSLYMKGSVTFDHTYATTLDQTGSRLFRALSLLHNHVSFGADVSNAFAEANTPKTPLYVTIDDVYCERSTTIEG